MKDMELLGGYRPIDEWMTDFEACAKREGAGNVSICVMRDDMHTYTHKGLLYKNDRSAENLLYLDKLIKTLLYAVGGSRIFVCAPKAYANSLQKMYSEGGVHDFDARFFKRVFGRLLEITPVKENDIPSDRWERQTVAGNWDGRRVGFDAGGSDMKICSVKDGRVIYSEEIVWNPKLQTNPSYHYNQISEAIKKAAAQMDGVDALGISTAGVVIDGRLKVSSLFIKVPEEAFLKEAQDIYLKIAGELGVPVIVANDGDVAALEGAVSMGETKLLGLAMGTSEATGYVDSDQAISGWLNELAFAPLDMDPFAAVDEWSLDRGVGASYLCQEGVIRLAGKEGIKFEPDTTPAEKLKRVQALLSDGDIRCYKVFRGIGIYLADALSYYSRFYDISCVSLLGRVMKGEGGNIVRECAEERLQSKLGIRLLTPDADMRLVGQAYAAASLPLLRR